ncbi:hypothetical protein [Pseudomonas sp. NPDC086278]|uniref:hypothetical protein n=1 Tax=Pseudomonas sp. NPDC086278 TaxID=3390646 RepID=UPI003D051F10
MKTKDESEESTTTEAPLVIHEIGSFFVGGEVVSLSGMPKRARVSTLNGPAHPIEQNGEIVVGQMYVQYVKLAAPRGSCPLMLWHGGGMTGVNWETTPDGRPGWQMFFLRAGFDVYVSDAVERGRASWAPYPQIYDEVPYFRTAREAWEETFRFGPAGSWNVDPVLRRPYSDLRFDAAHFESFMNQFVPRWATNNVRTQRAYDALIARMGHSILLTHSQGGNFGMTAALHSPEQVKAVISLEPSGAPDPLQYDPMVLRGVPHLFVWGDYLDVNPFWVHSMPAAHRWAEALRAANVDVEWIVLPERGIHGNSHALMADNNSDAIAALVLEWLVRKGLIATPG